MRRFYIDKDISDENLIELSPSDALHITKVLRLKPGTDILLIDRSGQKYAADLVSVERNKTIAQVISRTLENNESSVEITVATGILKEKKMDKILRQLTELGVTAWVPFYTQRSVPVADKKKGVSKLERWKKITIESLKQCERNVIPKIHWPLDFNGLMKESDQFECKLVFHERRKGTLDGITQLQKTGRVLIVFGPEGGFSEVETDMFRNHGFLFISMGPRILRAETAIIAGTSIIQHRFGDLK